MAAVPGVVQQGNATGNNNQSPAGPLLQGTGAGNYSLSQPAPPSVLDANTTTPNATAAAPAATPGVTSGQFNSALNNVIGLYQQLFGNEQAATGSAEANVAKGYDSQQGQLANSYAQAQSQVPWELVGRGAGSSSWADNANQFANNAYNNSEQGIQSGETNDLTNLQKQEQTAEGEGNYFMNTEAPQLRSLFPNLDPYYQSAQVGNLLTQGQQLSGQVAGNQSVGALTGQLQQNPSYTQPGSSSINNLISSLAGTGAPSAVQNQILAGVAGNPNTPISSNVLTNLTPPNQPGA